MKEQAKLFHSLDGEKIFFKPLRIDDVQEMHLYASDRDVSRFIGWNLMNSLEETSAHIETMLRRESEGTHLYASIAEKSTQKMIGTAMIFNFDRDANHAEIGYVLHKNHWGKGFGTEAVALMSDFAFKSLNLHKLYARVVHANVGSGRILEKNRYALEGRLKDHYFIEGMYYDALLFGKITNLDTSL
ncbi:GNAT family N-acetyltransferase [Metabacillus sp. KIGAM252]|uniref:GNAT family N-acetyltransferase n=1 Tax=Metabacillus flavus TaxID=2823519 RepID=A0ABS5LBI2_9BACI|nr:GNAT family protein [Metabacillus flavus]MBS2967819.1 GNAT family N-acetyltransferase [Metabacillus flavus]